MTFKALRGDTLEYLSDLFAPSHNDMYQLRSNDRKLYTENPIHSELYPGIAFLGEEYFDNLSSFLFRDKCMLE